MYRMLAGILEISEDLESLRCQNRIDSNYTPTSRPTTNKAAIPQKGYDSYIFYSDSSKNLPGIINPFLRRRINPSVDKKAPDSPI